MIDELAAAPGLLIASDFDGTLSEIVEDPDLAVPLARSKAALEALARLEGTAVAIISGRRRADLANRFDPSFVLIGEHGADHGLTTGPETVALTRARDLVDEAVQVTPGSRAEHKSRSVGFHYRLVPDPEEIVERLRRQAFEIEGIEILEGKMILELTDSPVSKGMALAALKRSLGVERVVFMGDDVTDESAFAVLEDGDVGIHVGPGPTGAEVTVPDPSALADLLEALLAARSAR
ncbi:MAG: trehalose-phosphatase [Acidimicrobiia bacterium]